ncbi:hypothetical protein LV779_24705 [Streptomyces thinghirensis]|nr:hypothetical protein [Streptomyces thinghirensis]
MSASVCSVRWSPPCHTRHINTRGQDRVGIGRAHRHAGVGEGRAGHPARRRGRRVTRRGMGERRPALRRGPARRARTPIAIINACNRIEVFNQQPAGSYQSGPRVFLRVAAEVVADQRDHGFGGARPGGCGRRAAEPSG